MKINLNEEITNYIESIIEALPVYKKAEKRFIKDLKNDIQDLIYSNPNMNINHIIETFGEPQDVIQDYINNANIKKENIKGRATIIIILFVCVVMCFSLLLNKVIHNSSINTEEKKSYYFIDKYGNKKQVDKFDEK